ncbi:hypothetical protein Fot_56298 [Forsythia ovata]|uniref:Uncharacterized protein n=1 Tax=Forsythia ovata TaxID=205694 RepID=A0ABD1P0D7_9LAMI
MRLLRADRGMHSVLHRNNSGTLPGKMDLWLCAEAVKDEILRCQKLISPDEAMARHFNFCNKFRSSGPPEDPTVRLITAMRQILRKSLESPKSLRSMPSSPLKNRGDGNMKGMG